MKALLFSFFLILACSCNKKTDTSNTPEIDRELISEVKQIENSSARSLAYSKLNFNEKFIIWQEHLTEWKNISTLNKVQKEIITEVLLFIKPEMWVSNSSKFAVANSETTAILQYKIKKNFSKFLAGKNFRKPIS